MYADMAWITLSGSVTWSSSVLYILLISFLGSATPDYVPTGGIHLSDRGLYNPDQPTFTETDRNITAGPGDRAVLKCRVEHLGTKTVTWRKRSEAHPLTIGLFTFVGDTRISVDFNQRTNEWSLIIQDVKPTDEGLYECQISTKQENLPSYEVKLNVKTVQVLGTDYVELGSQIQLMCNATGKPTPPHDVEWYKDDKKINSDAQTGILITKKIETKVLISVLVIKRSKVSDNGLYICRSSNRDSGHIKVHVLNVSTNNVKRGTASGKRLMASTGNSACRITCGSLHFLLTMIISISWILQGLSVQAGHQNQSLKQR